MFLLLMTEIQGPESILEAPKAASDFEYSA